MYNLNEDLSALTTIPTSALNKLTDKAAICICNCVEESVLKEEKLTEINIGIGTLQLLLEGNDLKYRFIPSKNLEAELKATIVDKKNPLTVSVEEALVRKILVTYKNYM